MTFNFTAFFFLPPQLKDRAIAMASQVRKWMLRKVSSLPECGQTQLFQLPLLRYLHLSFSPILLSGFDDASLRQVHGEFAGGGNCQEEGYWTSSAPPALLSHNRRPAMRKE